jgi:hypothetical protein
MLPPSSLSNVRKPTFELSAYDLKKSTGSGIVTDRAVLLPGIVTDQAVLPSGVVTDRAVLLSDIVTD